MAKPQFLTRKATAKLKRLAIKSCFKRFNVKWNRVAGGNVKNFGGVTWLHTPGGQHTILWPLNPRIGADKALDHILSYFRRVEAPRVSCSFRHPSKPRDLSARLLARGFQWHPEPNQWMWLDCRGMDRSASCPKNVTIQNLQIFPDAKADDLPFFSSQQAAILPRLLRERPPSVFFFAVWQHNKLIGQATLHISTGKYGIASLHDVGVVPQARGEGIGKALTLEVCKFAEQAGCRYVATNASPMGQWTYRSIGFEILEEVAGLWMSPRELNNPPSRARRNLIEAVGRGDLNQIKRTRIRAPLITPYPSGITPLEIAIKIAQSYETCDFLLQQGASPNGSEVTSWTPLILATEINRLDIVKLLLSQGARANMPDKRDRTAMAVATERGHQKILTLLQAHT